jgi:preprotein translocase subunit SecE
MASNRIPAARAGSGGKARQFLEEAWLELRYKVTWSSRQQLLKSTSVVLAVIVIVSLFIYVLDMVFAAVLRNSILRPL